jgi:glycosyltransferase involved in cell wall biosynthesis
MKILYHHRTRAEDAQGVHITELVKAFRSLGHEVILASLVANDASRPPEQDAQEHIAKKIARRVPYLYEAMQCGYNAVAFPWLLKKIWTERPDFIYERYSLFNFAGVLAAAAASRPIVLEVNSPLALEQHREREIRAWRFSAWMERVICKAATKVIVVSGPLRRILEENGVPASKIEILPNGVNLAHFGDVPPQSELRHKLRLDGRTVIGFAGWFRPWHGIGLLIDAFAHARLFDKGASLMLIGDGPETENLRRQVKQHGIEDYVVFTGPLRHQDVPLYLNLVDIAVQPAANEYCCPMKILEYMGQSKAIVAPRQENIEELLSDGRQARLFTSRDRESLAEALAELVENPAQRRSLGLAARRAIDDRGLTWTSNAETVVKLAFGETPRRQAQLAASASTHPEKS